MRQLPVVLLLVLFILPSQPSFSQLPSPQNDDHVRIAFGSCNDQNKPQPLWESIVATKPDLWVWLGDNIYANTSNMLDMYTDYQKQLKQEGYQQLLVTTPITGIWDDHDYAYDNAGADYEKKQQSQQLFLDFMGVPGNAPVRKQPGIYRSYLLGDGNKKIKLILLDVRYFRDKLRDIYGLYLPNLNGDILGDAQWEWLEQELTNSDAAVNIIASGIQVLPTGKAYTNWSEFPAARGRLLRLLQKTNPSVPIILSGDRHVGELSMIKLKGLDVPLFEITSSGMTHHREPRTTGNPFRVGKQVGALNFGVLDIDWQNNNTKITIQIRGENNKVLLQKQVVYPTLREK
ncbi:alkaline phosphatase D family protein [Pontibacter sp. MBLB2868]|uniref:alkaline phosphatase D family protein n=1 Tax=Pontibacter sp. MBLB2868 TaxID=3451555 RepID=UPI003F74DB6E